MKINLLIAVAVLSMALPVAAQKGNVVAMAYEAVLSDVRLPQSESGTIAFKECTECEYQTWQVGPNTRYLLDGRAVSLKDFTKALAGVIDRDEQPVTILHHIKDNRVVSVAVYL